MNVSIFTRLTGRHLDDAALAELWTNATADGAAANHPHLAGCAECRVRYASLNTWMDGIRDEAFAEADAIFTPDRLKAQQAQIVRRLEAAGQPTRIIAFPKATTANPRPSPIRRWVAAAAAAGLIAGVGLGQVLNLGRLAPRTSPPPRDVVTLADGRGRASGPTVIPASFNEERALQELDEVAVPRYDALRAYDTFTPRAADFIQPR